MEFIKGITTDLVHDRKLRRPEKIEDKVFYTVCYNLWNAVSDSVDEVRNMKKKNKELISKVREVKLFLLHLHLVVSFDLKS